MGFASIFPACVASGATCARPQFQPVPADIATPYFLGAANARATVCGIDFPRVEEFNSNEVLQRGRGLAAPETRAGSFMTNFRKSARWVLCLLLFATCATGDAQVPPHPPGTICFTPNFWCWMKQPGYPGTVCYCPSPYGLVRGVVG